MVKQTKCNTQQYVQVLPADSSLYKGKM